MTSLKHCPFCGGEAESIRQSFDAFFVICHSCYTTGKTYATETEAVAAWNTRAQTVFGMTLDEVRQMMKRDAERNRTCEVLGEDYDELLEYWETELSCGHVFNGMAQYVNYCPKCGARVVGE